MAIVQTDDVHYHGMADAIRAMIEKDTKYTPAEMVAFFTEGGKNVKPWNIPEGITIMGVPGTLKLGVTPGDPTWPFPDADDTDPSAPPSEDAMDEAVQEDDADAPIEDKMVLVDNNGNITVGYLYGDDFEITYYDPVTTEFKAVGWRRVSKHTTGELAGQITKDDFTTQESGGWNYLKNIRMCTREKLYYQGIEVWPDCMLPILAPERTWYKGSTSKSSITQIDMVDSYEPTGSETESWIADADNLGSVMCYVNGTVLTIAGNGSGKIMASPSCNMLFYGFSKVTSINGLGIFDTSNVTNMRAMIYGFEYLTTIDVSGFDTSNVTDMNSMFSSCQSLTTLDLSGFNTSNVTDMNSMFYNCKALTDLDLSGFNTSNVTGMSNMFSSCQSLTDLDLSGFNTSNVTNMRNMFYNCKALTDLDLSGFNTSNVVNMSGVFQDCYVLTTLDLSGFNTSNVTDMNSMFSSCQSLTTLDLSGFNTSNVTDMNSMFYSCRSLTIIDVSGFNTSNVTNMKSMFYRCEDLTTLDLSGFDTSNVTNMNSMFYNCESLSVIYVGDGWTTSNASTTNMFSNCGVSSVTHI